MFLFIPELGTEIILASPWTFALYDEHRNASLIKMMPNHPWLVDSRVWRWGAPRQEDYTLPVGTRLVVDRIYIRRGNDAFSSVTFRCLASKDKTANPMGKGFRFWAKLADVNRIAFNLPVSPDGDPA